ncbi:DUF3592 domain-containing protein [Actinomadura sp. 6N118]|uniref:DUF3592 domain-containing protein n=1 Tax=Actinomadura sp. 6N118 TaxID=3375151 RepID=UPI0037918725
MEQWFYICPGVPVFALGVFLLLRACWFTKRAVRVPGKVMTFKGARTHESDSRRVEFEFQTLEGRPVTAEAHLGQAGRTDVGVGDDITVMYDPNKPTRARIDKKGLRGYQIAWMTVGLGSFWLLAGIFGLMLG